jgi:hypothetical protein
MTPPVSVSTISMQIPPIARPNHSLSHGLEAAHRKKTFQQFQNPIPNSNAVQLCPYGSSPCLPNFSSNLSILLLKQFNLPHSVHA